MRTGEGRNLVLKARAGLHEETFCETAVLRERMALQDTVLKCFLIGPFPAISWPKDSGYIFITTKMACFFHFSLKCS